MRRFFHVALSVACLAGVTAAVAQTQERVDAIATCVAKAQREVPMDIDSDPNDPQYSQRTNIYTACMIALNQNP